MSKGPRWRSATQYAAVVRKEVRQTIRDRRVMFLLVAAPFIQTILFGFALNFDVDRVPTAVADLDRSAASRDYARRLLADGTLLRGPDASGAPEADRLLDRDQVAAALVFPAGFAADVAAGRTGRMQLLLDGSDPIRAATAQSAAERCFSGDAKALLRARFAAAGARPPAEISIAPRMLYNPRLKTAVYIEPGIMAMLLVVVTTVVTAMGLSREREMGTLEQVLVTPIGPFVLLAGKMTPFVVIGLFDVLAMLTAISWIFEVPLRGPLPVLALGGVVYLCSTLGIGLLISTLSQTQQQSFLGGILFIMPAALLSGVMTQSPPCPAGSKRSPMPIRCATSSKWRAGCCCAGQASPTSCRSCLPWLPSAW